MLSVVISYKFKEALDTSGFSIPDIEVALAAFINQNLYDAEMIEVTQFNNQGYPEYTEYPVPPTAVFIEFIAEINLEVFDDYISNENALNDYIISGFRRERIYLEDHWTHRGDKYFVVRLIKFSGKLPGYIL